MALRDGDRGLAVHCHRGCPAAEIYAELRRQGLLGGSEGSLSDDPEIVQRRRQAERADRRRRIAAGLDIWSQTCGDRGNLAERYLRLRGYTGPIPSTIRAHGLIRHTESGEQRPAMVGLVEHVEHGRVGVHLTYINQFDPAVRVTIAPRKRTIGPVAGGAVRLGPVRPDQWLVVGEGLESTLSAMQLWHCHSGWAALSANGLRNLILPPKARLVRIAVDNDESGVGQAAARDAAWLWEDEGRTVRVALPPTPGFDFNDILLAGRI